MGQISTQEIDSLPIFNVSRNLIKTSRLNLKLIVDFSDKSDFINRKY